MAGKQFRGLIISLSIAMGLCGCASSEQDVMQARIVDFGTQEMSDAAEDLPDKSSAITDGIESGSEYVFKPSDSIDAENLYVTKKNEMTLSSGISKDYDYGYLSRDISGESGDKESRKEPEKEAEVILTAKATDGMQADENKSAGKDSLSAKEAEGDDPKQAPDAGSELSDKGINEASKGSDKAQGEDVAAVADSSIEGSGAVEQQISIEQPASVEQSAQADAAASENEASTDASAAEPPKEEKAPSTYQDSVYSDEQMAQICAFYDGTVFAGDSVMLGFRNYSKKSSDPMLSKLSFLAAGSLSLHNSFWEVSSKSVHPLYQGEQHPIWESIQMMGAKRAFLFFGINDVVYNLDESMSLYQQLVDKIREYSPDVDITIISATYTLRDKGKGKLNNANLAEFNRSAQALAAQNGLGFVDIANPLSDGEGNLAPQYCSDGFLHESNKAYEVWTSVLKKYAADRMGIQGSKEEPVVEPQ